MPFIHTLLLLAGLVGLVLTPMFVGHGLSEGDVAAFAKAAISLAVGVILIFTFTRIAGRESA